MTADSPPRPQDWREGLDGLANQHRPQAAAHCLRACLGELTGGALAHLCLRAVWSRSKSTLSLDRGKPDQAAQAINKHTTHNWMSVFFLTRAPDQRLLPRRPLSWQATWLKLCRKTTLNM